MKTLVLRHVFMMKLMTWYQKLKRSNILNLLLPYLFCQSEVKRVTSVTVKLSIPLIVLLAILCMSSTGVDIGMGNMNSKFRKIGGRVHSVCQGETSHCCTFFFLHTITIWMDPSPIGNVRSRANTVTSK